MQIGILVSIAALSVIHIDLSYFVDDSFQESEYASWGPAEREDPAFTLPILIHGGLDVLPSRIATAACPAGKQIVCVRAINAVFQFIAALLLLSAAVALAGSGTPAAVAACLPALILLVLVDGRAVTPVDGHQATPGIRDLFALAALLPMIRVAWRLDHGRGCGRGAPALLGAVAASAPFWAYNRGLVVVLTATAFILSVCVRRRSAWPAFWAASGAAVTAAGLLATGGPVLFQATIGNIVYWSHNTALWRTPVSVLAVLPAVAFHAIAFALAAPVATAEWRAGRPGRVLLTMALTVMAALFVIQALDRSDAIHMRWTLWPAALLMAIGVAGRLGHAGRSRLGDGAACTAGLLVCAACASWLSAPPRPGQFRAGLAANARLLRDGAPSDRSLADPDLVRVADRVHASGRCTFAADNAGLVYLLSGMPPCSRLAFGAYVGAGEQARVIADLTATQPAVILWDAPFWWAHIDGRSFADRTPELAAWIAANYPVVTSIGMQTIRTRAPPSSPQFGWLRPEVPLEQ